MFYVTSTNQHDETRNGHNNKVRASFLLSQIKASVQENYTGG